MSNIERSLKGKLRKTFFDFSVVWKPQHGLEATKNRQLEVPHTPAPCQGVTAYANHLAPHLTPSIFSLVIFLQIP